MSQPSVRGESSHLTTTTRRLLVVGIVLMVMAGLFPLMALSANTKGDAFAILAFVSQLGLYGGAALLAAGGVGLVWQAARRDAESEPNQPSVDWCEGS